MRKYAFTIFILFSILIVSYEPISYKASSEKKDFSSTLSTTEKSWHFVPKNDGTPSGAARDSGNFLEKYNGSFLGDTSKKEIYLTFDEGYENGYTSKILDILKANNVKAAFFVTTPYIKSEEALIKRMVAEGHLVCNHSTTHPSMASITDEDKFNNELITCQNTFETLTGTKMPRFFRPPMGKYSELSLYRTQQLGYKTIFWSFAYVDWFQDKQPREEYARKIIMQRTHNGGIFLLHAVSVTNTNVLDYIIKQWKDHGFELKTLDEL